LPPHLIGDQLWFDGGSAFNLELPSIVDHCRKLGYEDKDTIVDIVLLSPTE